VVYSAVYASSAYQELELLSVNLYAKYLVSHHLPRITSDIRS